MAAAHDPRFEALQAELERGYAAFAAAETLDEYRRLHGLAEAAARAAVEIQSAPLAFGGWALAGAAAYALATSPGATGEDAWLIQAYQAVRAAEEHASPGLPVEWLLSYAAVLAEIHEPLSMKYWREDQKTALEGWEARLAHASEAVLPAPLADPRDPGRASQVARGLAELSYRYGTKKIARAHLEHAIASAERAGALQAWVDGLYTRYQHEKQEAQFATRRLNQADSLDDLDAWLEDLIQSRQPQPGLAERRAELRAAGETLRGSFRSRTGRLWAAQHLAPMQLEFFKDELSGTVDEGALFDAVDRMKARLLLDYLLVPGAEITDSAQAAQALAVERQILSFEPESPRTARDVLLHEMRLMSELPIGSAVGDIFHPKSKTLRLRQLSRLEAIYAGQQAGFSSAGAHPPAHDVIAQALDEDEALVEYFLLPNRENPRQQQVFIFVLTRERVYLRQSSLAREPGEQWMAASISIDGRQPLDQTLAGDRAISLRLALQDGRDQAAGSLLRMFYDVLVAPILELGISPGDFQRWIIVPHSALHSIPFAALLSPDGRFLIEDVALAVAPSAAVWYTLQAGARPPAASFAGFANPFLMSAKWPPLPEAEEEVAQICAGLKGLACTSHVAEEATEAAVRAQAAGKSLVHFATHGDFPESDVIDLHRILLAPAGESDGRLHAEEIRRLDLRAARLVALSICNGGIYRVGPGDEPYGLVAAFLAGGAENVTGTLWPVEDRAGRAFMVEFYRRLLTRGPAEAYRRACIHFLRAGAPLRDWAGWVPVGPGRAISAKSASKPTTR